MLSCSVFFNKRRFFKRTLSAWLHYIWWQRWDQVAIVLLSSKTHIVVYDNKVRNNLASSQSEEQHVRGGGIERNPCNRREHIHFCKHDAGDTEGAAKSYASTTREPKKNDVGVNEQQKAEFAKYREEVSSACARIDSRGSRTEPKLPKPTLQKLDPSDDIEHYIATFERIAQQQKWPEDMWSTQLAGLLIGKAMAAYASMDQRWLRVLLR